MQTSRFRRAISFATSLVIVALSLFTSVTNYAVLGMRRTVAHAFKLVGGGSSDLRLNRTMEVSRGLTASQKRVLNTPKRQVPAMQPGWNLCASA